MGISVVKITLIFNKNIFPGIDWHREVIKVRVLSLFHVETATLTTIQSTVGGGDRMKSGNAHIKCSFVDRTN